MKCEDFPCCGHADENGYPDCPRPSRPRDGYPTGDELRKYRAASLDEAIADAARRSAARAAARPN